MSRPFVASSPRLHALFAVATLLIALARPAASEAQSAAPWVFWKAPLPEASHARELRAALARVAGPLEFDAEQKLSAQAPSLTRDRLLPLAQIETALGHAREEAAALAEGEALASLAEADRLGRELGDIEGAAAWNAEIQLGIGVVAAQAGLLDLAAIAFRTALTLDPTRRLFDAEAAPEVLALYDRVQREVALAPLGQLEVRVLAPNARVFLDDVDLGPAPARLRAPVGRHIVRVEAPGQRVYGSFVDVLEGERPAFVVALSPSRELEAARALSHAAAAGDYAAIERGLRPRTDGSAAPSLFVVEASRSGQKALLVRCDPRGCKAPERVLAKAPTAPRAGRPPALSPPALAEARDWLERRELGDLAQSRTHPALWQRWYFWGAIVAAAAVGTVLAVRATSQPTHRFRVVIDGGDIGQ